MKTTLDLPDDLLRELRRRAAEAGRPLEVVAADLLAAGLLPGAAAPAATGEIVPKRLPLIKARPASPAGAEAMTAQGSADAVKGLELQDELERYERAFGHHYVDRAGD